MLSWKYILTDNIYLPTTWNKMNRVWHNAEGELKRSCETLSESIEMEWTQKNALKYVIYYWNQ